MTRTTISNTPSSMEIGYAFEKFIVSKFDPEFFRLMEWRSDKSVDGRYPVSSQYPDLEFEFERVRKCYRFAVECKYQRAVPKGSFTWAKNALQVDNYRSYANEKKISVFVILGYGGQPTNPKKLFCVPLVDLRRVFIDWEFLSFCQRKNPLKPFYIHTEPVALK